ncbi:Nonspecific lipid-transfer protein precursor, putative [Ricinus communis]|uniref:Non-specific lipid-transfer protein n=2 Tax=Ricinus communis TaxID=3988 RepID=B9SF15_RICCO|nr:Nonspecific lipid-transfer protein precursor, putative [Ricinus communis]
MEKKVMILMGMWAMLLVLLMMSNAMSVHGISCTEAVAAMNPCLPFLIGAQASPVAPCCLAVQNVNQEASTKEIRRELCDCFKKAGPALGVKPDKAKQLPDLCHVQVPVPIDPTIDCSKVTEDIAW